MTLPVRWSLLLLLGFALVPAGAASSAGPGSDSYTPVVLSFVDPPAPVLGSDGRYHFVFEVQALNATAFHGLFGA